MRDQGAHQFCWIRPNEALLDQDKNNRWICCKNGAFAYLFHDGAEGNAEENKKDCFFIIEDVTDVFEDRSQIPEIGIQPFSIAKKRNI